MTKVIAAGMSSKLTNTEKEDIRSNLGATTIGTNLFTLTDPSAITFMRINADNTVSTLNAASFRTAIDVLPASGGTLTGDLVIGSTVRSADSFVRVLSAGGYKSGLEAYGSSQGTGYCYVGQDSLYGGGLSYNGDGTPAFATGETPDYISFYRRNNGTQEVVFSYPYHDNAVTFRGSVTATSFSGVGTSLTSLNASNLTSGTVPNGRLSGTYTGMVSLTSGRYIANSTTAPALQSNNYFSTYGSGISEAIYINELVILAVVDIKGDSRNYFLDGTVIIQAAQAAGKLSFSLGIRSNALPAKAFNFSYSRSELGIFGGEIVAYNDTASNKVYIALNAPGTLHNLTVKLDAYTRSNYSDSITMYTTKSLLDTTGLTQITPALTFSNMVGGNILATSGLKGRGSLGMDSSSISGNPNLFDIQDQLGNVVIELGRRDGIAGSSNLDFHSGATAVDFDTRIQASGGNGTNGKGTLDFFAGSVRINGVAVATVEQGTRAMVSTNTTLARLGKRTRTLIDTTSGNVTITLNPGLYSTGDVEELIKIVPGNVLTIAASTGVISLPDGTSAASHTLTGVRGNLILDYVSATELRLSAIF